MAEPVTGERTLAQQLAAFAAHCYTAGVPDDVAASVRQRVLDVVGLCVAAHRLETSAGAVAFVRESCGL